MHATCYMLQIIYTYSLCYAYDYVYMYNTFPESMTSLYLLHTTLYVSVVGLVHTIKTKTGISGSGVQSLCV